MSASASSSRRSGSGTRPFWLADEPTSHLDLGHQVACLELFRAEARAGRALLVVLHDLTQAHALADDALLLHPDGSSRFGAAAELLRPAELEPVFETRLHEVHGPEEVALVPAYHEHPREGDPTA